MSDITCIRCGVAPAKRDLCPPCERKVCGSERPRIVFRRVHPRAKAPTRASEGASGWDVYACIDDTGGQWLRAGARAVISTGLAVADMPPGWELQVRPRSGLAAKFGITIPNTPGTIDSDYRGEVRVILARPLADGVNGHAVIIRTGDRIAQLVPARVPEVDLVLEDDAEVTETERGEGGFGSTGMR